MSHETFIFEFTRIENGLEMKEAFMLLPVRKLGLVNVRDNCILLSGNYKNLKAFGREIGWTAVEVSTTSPFEETA